MSEKEADAAARCVPVTELLAKNYVRGARVDLAAVNLGFQWNNGQAVSPQDAGQLERMEQICRAWVYGAVTDAQYSNALMGLGSATVVTTTSPQDRDAVAASMTSLLEELKKRGSVPAAFDSQALRTQVAADAALSSEKLQERLSAVMAESGARLGRFADVAAARHAEVLARLSRIEAVLPAASGPKPGPGPDVVPAVPGPGLVEVYFSTGSDEVQHDARQRLAAAVQAWRNEGAVAHVTGYADTRGNGASNRRLALRRATAVAAVLSEYGLKDVHVTAGAMPPGAADLDSMRVVQIQLRAR